MVPYLRKGSVFICPVRIGGGFRGKILEAMSVGRPIVSTSLGAEGIPADNLSQIFDMFYTTNPQGLGFGLWWVKTFLEQQGGDIAVESQPNRGTTFTITLPCNPPSLRS